MYVTQVCFYTNVHICDILTAGCAHVCVCIHVCIWMRVCMDACMRLCYAWRVESLLLGVSVCACVCICMRMCVCAHVCVYGCMCVCVCMYVCISVYMCACAFVCARMWMYVCTRVGTFCLFVLSNLSTTCGCVTGVSNTCMRVCGGVGSVVCLSLIMVSACFWRGRLCIGRGRDRGFVLYMSLFLRVLG